MAPTSALAHVYPGNIGPVLPLNIGHTPRRKEIGFPELNSRTDDQNNTARYKGEAIHAKRHFSMKPSKIRIMPKSSCRAEEFYYRNYG